MCQNIPYQDKLLSQVDYVFIVKKQNYEFTLKSDYFVIYHLSTVTYTLFWLFPFFNMINYGYVIKTDSIWNIFFNNIQCELPIK